MSSRQTGTEKTTKFQKSGPKRGQRSYQADRRQILVIYLLANVQVVVWFVLSLVACLVNYAIDLWLIVMLSGMIIAMTPVSFEPVSAIIPASTNVVSILFLLQLRGANKRLDNIMDRLLGGK